MSLGSFVYSGFFVSNDANCDAYFGSLERGGGLSALPYSVATAALSLSSIRFWKKLAPFISAFSAILFLRALRDTKVLLIAHVTIPDATIRIVAARTIHPPHCMCGTKSRMSTRKARRETRRVGNERINNARRYRGE